MGLHFKFTSFMPRMGHEKTVHRSDGVHSIVFFTKKAKKIAEVDACG